MSTGTQIEANPGTTENQAGAGAEGTEKKRKGRQAKPKHALVEAGTKLESVPADFDEQKHAGLKEEDFNTNNLDVFYDMQYTKFQRRADRFKGQAESFRSLGAFTDRDTAKKASDTFLETKDLISKLAAQGENVEDLKAMLMSLFSDGEAKTEEKAAA